MFSVVMRHQAVACGGSLRRATLSASRNLSLHPVAPRKLQDFASTALFSTSASCQFPANTGGPTPILERTLFVANVSPRAKWQGITEALNSLGVKYTHLRTDKGRPFCHVGFATREDAQAALEAGKSRDITLNGRRLRFEFAQAARGLEAPTPWVLADGLPLGSTPRTFADLMSVSPEKAFLTDPTCGFADFRDAEHAKKVVDALNIGTLKLKYLQRPLVSLSPVLRFATGLCPVSLDAIRDMFAEFQDKIVNVLHEPKTERVGYITFTDSETATAARDALNGTRVGDSEVFLTYAKTYPGERPRPGWHIRAS